MDKVRRQTNSIWVNREGLTRLGRSSAFLATPVEQLKGINTSSGFRKPEGTSSFRNNT